MWITKVLPLLVLINCCYSDDSDTIDEVILDLPEDPKVDKNVIMKLRKLEAPEFIEYYGYPSETYEVTTSDGYILTLNRIPHGRNNGTEDGKPKPVVFFMHGFISYSRNWMTAGPDKSLPFLLADSGHDVWLGNARGNVYSRKHVTLNPDKKPFWDFSWHEIGVIDVTCMIDFILNLTHQEKLFYIGHSQGTTVYYVMLSEKPEYAKKIIAQFSLAPIGCLETKVVPAGLFKYESTLEMFINTLPIHELTNRYGVLKVITQKLCPLKYINGLCIWESFNGAGFDYAQLNASLIPIMTYHYPAGSSMKQAEHFMQLASSDKFRQFDHGIYNDYYYGQKEPPRYKLEHVTPPIYLMYSLNDEMSSVRCVNKLYDELPEGNKVKRLTPFKKWNHLDYLLGEDAKTYVYDYIMDEMQKYLQN